MENNPYGYSQPTTGQLPQQPYNTIYPGMYLNQPPGAPQAVQPQQKSKSKAPTTPARMPKERALALAHRLKNTLAVASVATFAALSGLVAYHQINSSSQQKSNTTTNISTQQQNSNPFFNQQGANHLGSSTPTATATANQSASTPTTTAGSSSGPIVPLPSNPNSGSHTS